MATKNAEADEYASSDDEISDFSDDDQVPEGWAEEEEDANVDDVARIIEERLPHLSSQFGLVKFKAGDDSHLRRAWGSGSVRTNVRQAQKRRELASAAQASGQRTLDQCFFAKPATQNDTDANANSSLCGFQTDELRSTIDKLDKQLTDQKNVRTPNDTMRLIAIRIYMRNLLAGEGKMKASEAAAQVFKSGWNHKARMVRLWADLVIRGEDIPASRRGGHPKVKSLIFDEDIQAQCLEFLRSLKPKNLSPVRFLDHVNSVIIPLAAAVLGQSISLRTAQKWLKKLGFKPTKNQKGIYVDGHDREDVVEYRTLFLAEMERLSPFMETWTEDIDGCMTPVPPILAPGVRKHVLVVHDECAFHANDGRRNMWTEEGKAPFSKKDQGKTLMVSTFLCECHGELYTTLNGAREKVRAIITPGSGASDDGWWTSENMLAQFQHRALPAFEQLHPECVGVFMFDNSTNHKKMPDDCLDAHAINLSDGGKNARTTIRPGWFEQDGRRMTQLMVDESGVQKGVRRILQERGLWKIHMKLPDARKVLSEQDDFRSQKTVLQECVEADRGEDKPRHRFLLLPKYHCELNHIERFWSSAKRHARSMCDYTFSGLKLHVPQAHDSVSVDTIRRNARTCYRWMDAYRKGLSTPMAQYAVKKYSSHRRIPAHLDLEMLRVAMEKDAQKSLV